MVDKVILYAIDGRPIPVSVTEDGRGEGESEDAYLTRMAEHFVPAEHRASVRIVPRAEADAAVRAAEPPAEIPTTIDDLERALVSKGILSEPDIAAAKTARSR